MVAAAPEIRPFIYPHGFAERVRAEYAGHDKILQALATGEYLLGKYLMEGVDLGMGPEQIVRSIEDGRADLVLEEARAAVRRKSLYVEWTRVVVQHVQSIEGGQTLRVVP